MNIRYSLLFFLLIGINILISKSFRVNHIPNGSVNSCSNCHISQFGGGARTDFGNNILSNYLDNTGNVIWGSQLAQIDSDGDGFTNGFELGDPNGSWVVGSDNPGDPQFVTNPGDINSLDIKYTKNVESTFILYQNHPNPFNPLTTISYVVPYVSDINLAIYDLKGNEILYNHIPNQSTGHHSFTWDSRDKVGNEVAGGVYLYTINVGNYSKTKKMLLLK